MKDSYLPKLLQMRRLAGYLGEKAQLGSWPTSFFGEYDLTTRV